MKITCPRCRDAERPVTRESPFFPFCSRDCRDRDLSSWLREDYRVDAGPIPPGVDPDTDSIEN